MQVRIAKSMHDNDRILNKRSGNYLARAETHMKDMFGEALRKQKGCKVDKLVRLVLTDEGPTYMSLKVLNKTSVRRVGDLYYTVEFASFLFREAVLRRGVLSQIKEAAVRRATESGCQLVSLFPNQATQWFKLVADAFSAPPVLKLRDALTLECEANGEHKSISIDGTVKPMFTSIRRSSFLAPSEIKMKQATPVSEQRHTLLTGMGLSWAVLLLKGAWSEGSTIVSAKLRSELTPPQAVCVCVCAAHCRRRPERETLRILEDVLPELDQYQLVSPAPCVHIRVCQLGEEEYRQLVSPPYP